MNTILSASSKIDFSNKLNAAKDMGYKVSQSDYSEGFWMALMFRSRDGATVELTWEEYIPGHNWSHWCEEE